MSRHQREGLRRELAQELRARQRATDALDEAVADHLRINRTDLRCLDVLLDHGSATPGHLATALGLTTGSVTAMLDRMEALGYVRREHDATDRRRINVVPTAKTIETTMALYGPLVEEGERYIARYSAEDLEILIDFTRRDRELQERHTERVRELPARQRGGRREAT